VLIADPDGAERKVLADAHPGGVASLAAAATAKVLVTGGGTDNTVKVWNSDTGALLRTMEGHTDNVLRVAVSSSGKTAVSGGLDKTIRVWEADAGKLHRAIDTPSNRVSILALSPNGRSVTITPFGNAFKLHDSATGQQVRMLQGPSKFTAAAFSHDNTLFAAVTVDGQVSAWATLNGQSRFSVSVSPSSLDCLAFSRDGRILAVAGAEGSVRLLDPTKGTEMKVLAGAGSPVVSLAFSPEGKVLAGTLADGSLILWDPSANQEPAAADLSGKGGVFVITSRHSGKVLGLDQGETLEGTKVVTADYVKGDKSQLWRAVANGDGWVSLENVKCGLVMSVRGNRSRNGAEIVISRRLPPPFADYQLWRADPVAREKDTFTLLSRKDRVMGVDAKLLTSGARILLWDDENNSPQWFTASPPK
jgi:WD40 repeat protein